MTWRSSAAGALRDRPRRSGRRRRATHAGSFDVAYLGCLPDMVLMAASDEVELVHMVATAAAIDDRPSASAIPRRGRRPCHAGARGVLEIGNGSIVQEGAKVALAELRRPLQECIERSAGSGGARAVDNGRRCPVRQAAGRGSDPPRRHQPRSGHHDRGRFGRRLRQPSCTSWREPVCSTRG